MMITVLNALALSLFMHTTFFSIICVWKSHKVERERKKDEKEGREGKEGREKDKEERGRKR
jgi:hypothetical protein